LASGENQPATRSKQTTQRANPDRRAQGGRGVPCRFKGTTQWHRRFRPCLDTRGPRPTDQMRLTRLALLSLSLPCRCVAAGFWSVWSDALALPQCDFHLQFSKRLKIGCDWGSAASLLGSGRGGGLGRPWSVQEQQSRSRQQQQCGAKALGGLSIMTMGEEDVSDHSDCEILDLDALARERSQCATPHASGGSSSALVGSRGGSPSPTSFFAAFMPKQDGDCVPTMILYRSPSPVQFERRGNDLSIVSFDGGHHHDRSVAIYSQPQRRPFLREALISPLYFAHPRKKIAPHTHSSTWCTLPS
jgi:hypothetical protein